MWEVRLDEEVREDIQAALENFDKFLEVCKEKKIKVTEDVEDTILLLIKTIIAYNLENIGFGDYDYYLNERWELEAKSDDYCLNFLVDPLEFLEVLKDDIEDELEDRINEHYDTWLIRVKKLK
jgi:hypothetical protein